MKTIRVKHSILGGIFLLSAALVLSGCSTGTVHFNRKVSASKIFERYRVLPDHHYYGFGRPHAPVALVAIRNGYRLDSPNWKALDMSEAALKSWVRRMLNQPGSEFNTEPNGAYIYNDSGKVIGVWYSVWVLPILRFTSETTFLISDPVTAFPSSNTEPRFDWNY
jgi:hypothetical protein